MDDSEIKEGDFVYSSYGGIFKRHIDNNCQTVFPISKITHSTQPESLGMGWMQSVQPLLLSEVKELLGVVDVEKKAFELAILFHNTYEKLAPAFGYETRLDTKVFDKNSANGKLMIAVCKEIYQALEDNNHKKWTDTDVIRIVEKSRQTGLTAEYLMLSLQPQTEWEVEIVDGKLKLKQ